MKKHKLYTEVKKMKQRTVKWAQCEKTQCSPDVATLRHAVVWLEGCERRGKCPPPNRWRCMRATVDVIISGDGLSSYRSLCSLSTWYGARKWLLLATHQRCYDDDDARVREGGSLT